MSAFLTFLVFTIGYKYFCKRYYEEVIDAAKGFIALGLRPGFGVGIMAPSSPQW